MQMRDLLQWPDPHPSPVIKWYACPETMGYKISIIKAKGQRSKKVQLSAEHSISGPGHLELNVSLANWRGGFREIKKNNPKVQSIIKSKRQRECYTHFSHAQPFTCSDHWKQHRNQHLGQNQQPPVACGAWPRTLGHWARTWHSYAIYVTENYVSKLQKWQWGSLSTLPLGCWQEKWAGLKWLECCLANGMHFWVHDSYW